MPLPLGRDLDAVNVETLVGLEFDEFNPARKRFEVDREVGRGMLEPKGLLDHVMAAVNPNLRTGGVGRSEKREAHDVVPMHMGHEYIYDHGLRRLARHDVLAESPSAAAHVAHQVFGTSGLDFHAGGMSAIGLRYREIEIVVDE